MTKKLFVVLVVVSAMLISFSLVMAAKNGGLRHVPDRFVKSFLSNQQSATQLPKAHEINPQVALTEQSGRPIKSTANPVTLTGTPTRLGNPSGKDLCDLAGTPAYFITDYIYGLEWYANYQDPTAFGCSAVWPFQVTEIDFQMNFPPEWVQADVSVQGYVFEDVGTPSCPLPEDTPGYLCATPVYTYTIPAGGGYFELPMPMVDQCCVDFPYFAVVYISTDLYGLGVDAVSEGVAATCRSYNDWGSGWSNLNSFPGPIMLYSQGYTHPQNPCPAAGDTCGVSSVTPSNISILAGATADYTANVYYQGTQTSCMLTVTPDPVCPGCVTTITPNPVSSPATSATVSIATSGSTPAGVYPFDVGGAKASATLTVLASTDSCYIHRWTEGSGYRFDGWSAGDQNAVLLDPAACTACGATIYPFQIKQVVSRWVNPAAATSMDVIFHIYEAGAPCDGPGPEIYQFPATITAWSPTYVSALLPDVICVDGPFWVAAEYVSVTPATVVFPSLRMSTQVADTCVQFNKYQGDWYEWYDFWGPPQPGYYYIGVVGSCNGSACPIECDMQEDNGAPASYFSQLADKDKVAKFYDPTVYCTGTVYPYHPTEADLVMYVPSAWGAKTVDVKVGIYLQCQNVCDGPGTQIYLSPKVTLNVPTGVSVQTVPLPGSICLYEPFFVALEYNSGTTGATPSILFDNNTVPMDTCHGWMWFESQGYSPPWYEWNDFWSQPAPGRPMIRVVGTTNDPVCNPAPCDTTVEMIPGASYAYYYWKQPPNDEFLNMKFEMPSDHGGTLEGFEVAFYWPSAHPNWGTPDPDFYVWLSDGTYPLDNNPPYQAIADFHMNYSDIVWYPSYNYISTYSHVLNFDPGEKFHIGFSHAFNPGDTLAVLSNDGGETNVADNPSGWYAGAWESYSPYALLIDAFICPIAPEAPTFTIKCSPSLGYATPGDPPVNVFQVELTPILGYNLPVTMSLLSVTPPAAITATFNPNPATPPDTADVAIQAAVGVPYGNYVLTFQAVGSDDQVKVCNVTLTVQPPFDEAVVNFYHGYQRTSNFGAVGNDAKSNFVWYGTNYLFDGSFMSATTDADHMAMDVYNCTHLGFIPSQHIAVTHQPWCSPPFEEDYGEVAYSNFYTEEDAISCEWDSLFVVGLSNVVSTDFSIKIKIYYNPTSTPIPQLHIGLYEDWDIGDAYNNWVGMDTLHNILYQYDPVDPTLVFGMFKAPFYNEKMWNMVAVRNPVYVWPGSGFCDPGFPELKDSLYLLMTRPGWTYPTAPDTDFSLLMCPPPFSLNPGEKHMEIWFDFGRNTADGFTWEQWYHRLLRYAGFYRGDVNASDTLELPALDVSDLVYLINYLYEGGPRPQPFIDQGNVDGKGPYGGPVDTVCPKNNVDVQDLVYLVNYVFKGGPAPIDYVRFIPQFWSRTSLFTNPNWH
jgi:hypothetical protein